MQNSTWRIAHCYDFTPPKFPDERGMFFEWFKASEFEAVTGHPFRLRQANGSISKLGTLRGIHFAEVPPGQAKYVSCVVGAVLDVVVDIRVGSPTFGEWEALRIDDVDRRCVYIQEGLGHAFMALTETAMVSYLCSEPYAPGREHGINPFDPEIGIEWPEDVVPLLSAKDREAPSLREAERMGLLPSYDACTAYYEQLRRQA